MIFGLEYYFCLKRMFSIYFQIFVSNLHILKMVAVLDVFILMASMVVKGKNAAQISLNFDACTSFQLILLSASALIDCYVNEKGATPTVIHCNESVAIQACFYRGRIGTDEIERGCGDEDHFIYFIERNAAPNNTNINISSKMDKCMQTLVMRTCLCSQMECNGNCESENCKTVTSDEEVNEVCDPKCTKMTNSNGIDSKGAFLMVMIFHVTRRIMA